MCVCFVILDSKQISLWNGIFAKISLFLWEVKYKLSFSAFIEPKQTILIKTHLVKFKKNKKIYPQKKKKKDYACTEVVHVK